MYTMIENIGEAPVEAFQIMGVSTTRGSEGTIGMFGSGTKYAVCCLLREGYTVIIYSGLTRIEFSHEDKTINDGLSAVTFRQVICTVTSPTGEVKATPLNIVLEHGVLDWTDVRMGFREFFANALDRTYRQRGDYSIEYRTERVPEGLAGSTRIFISQSRELSAYCEDIDDYFLHFSRRHKLKVIDKHSLSPVRFYKNGVYIGQGDDNSLYDYNLEGFQLTESRVLNPNGIGHVVAKQYHYDEILTKRLLKHITQAKSDTFESKIHNEFHCCWQCVRSVWYEMYGLNAVPYNKADDLDVIMRSDKQPIFVLAPWVSILGSNKITVADSIKKAEHIRSRRETECEVLDKLHVMVRSLTKADKPKLHLGETNTYESNSIIIDRSLVGSKAFEVAVIQQGCNYYFGSYSAAEKMSELLWKFIGDPDKRKIDFLDDGPTDDGPTDLGPTDQPF